MTDRTKQSTSDAPHPSSATAAAAAGAIEACVDELDDFVATLTRYPEPIIAVALRLHLGGLLRAQLDQGALSETQVREFLGELEREVLN